MGMVKRGREMVGVVVGDEARHSCLSWAPLQF